MSVHYSENQTVDQAEEEIVGLEFCSNHFFLLDSNAHQLGRALIAHTCMWAEIFPSPCAHGCDDFIRD